MLVAGLVGGSTARKEPRRIVCFLGGIAGVVVVHLVIVPADEPGTGRVRRLQLRLALVERVACAIVVERVALGRAVTADAILAPGELVDVVAQVQDEVRLVGEHRLVRGVIAMLVLLARGDGEPQAFRSRIACGRRGGTTDRTARAAGREPVPVGATRFETAGLDVHGVRPVRHRVLDTGTHDPTKLRVGGDLPRYGHGGGRHAAARRERHGGEPRPQHDVVRRRIPGSDPERERARIELE
jgi:hypothetical protein